VLEGEVLTTVNFLRNRVTRHIYSFVIYLSLMDEPRRHLLGPDIFGYLINKADFMRFYCSLKAVCNQSIGCQ